MELLERDQQVAALRQYAADAAAGEGRVVLVAGEPGVGKSSLVERLQDEVPEARWLWAACDGLFTPRPLGPLLDVADQTQGDLADLVTKGAPRDRLFSALLRELNRTAPTVLVVEDVHWADEATLDLLGFLAKRVRDGHAMLVVTYRDDGLAANDPLRILIGELATQRSTRRVDIPPLSERAVAVLAGDGDVTAEELYRLTGGNPFFVTELLAAAPGELPPSARDAVLARVARLSEDPRRWLETAALDGTRVDPQLVTRAADVLVSIVDELVAAGLMRADGDGLRFRHELARLAVDSTVAPHRRTLGHRALLDALMADECDDDARLAYHAEGAGVAELVATFAPRAARQAAALGAHREAAAQFERALRFPPDDPVALAELHDALADELVYVDRWPEAAEARQRALQLWRAVGDRRREGEDQRRLSTVMWRLCRGPESVAALRRAVELLEPLGPNAELTRGYSAYAFEVWRTDPDAAEAMLRRSEAMAEELGQADLLSDVVNNLAFALFVRGEDWTRTMSRALQIALDADMPAQAGRAYANAYTFYAAQFRFPEGERYWLDGVAYCDERDITTYSTCLRGHRAVALVDMGRWHEAAALARRVLATEASPVNLITSQMALGLVLARRGEPGAFELLDAAVAEADGVDEAEWVAVTRVARAEASWLSGDLDGAKADLARARAMLSPMEHVEDCAVAAWEQRLVGRAQHVSTPTGPYADQLAGNAAAAASAWDALGCGYHAALALLDAGTEESLREALRRFEELGADAATQLTRRQMRSAGIKSVPNGARASTREHPVGLTRREGQVLELVTAGRTNEEIAASLFISIKTVDHHVSAVLAKLGVPSRHAAAREAERLGLAATPR